MPEYIKCRNCGSPDCKGCNLKNLETMLNNGKFDCLMNGNRCVNPSADVAPVVHGRWIEHEDMIESYLADCTEVFYECSACGGKQVIGETPYCPNCGAKMDLE